MSTTLRPLHQITEQAIAVLAREIGIVDTIRFVNQFSSGYGDYTAERGALFGDLTLDEIFADLPRARSGGPVD